MEQKYNQNYFKQVELLLQILPIVAEESCFTLRGGTAINLFIRDMPRLSVDIDLVYIPLDTRDEALKNIEASLLRIKQEIKRRFTNMPVEEKRMKVDNPGYCISHRSEK